MNRLAYTAFVAFWSVMATLLAVYLLSGEPAEESGASAGDRLPQISMDELARHDSRESCWKAIEGKVYDITDYIDDHPTSPRILTQWCGRESTEAWRTKGRGRPHSQSAEQLLEQYRIGTLKTDESGGHRD